MLQYAQERRVLKEAAVTEPAERAYEALVDLETGLYDRRTMWSRLAEEVSRAHRYRYPLCLMLLALDTAQGQASVEQVQRLAKILRDHTRAADILARYSADTLAIILPCTNQDGALCLAERLRKLVATAPPVPEGSDEPTTLMIGVTCAPGDFSGDKVALVEQVEWALQQAREEGGECTIVVPVPGQDPCPEEESA